jgi:hypothetical protein
LFARAEILNEEIFKDVLALSREILVKYPKRDKNISTTIKI